MGSSFIDALGSLRTQFSNNRLSGNDGRVLKAPDIPSVLIEIGFLSNPEDERLLASPEFRDLVVSSLVGAIDQYLKGGA